jgi:hypothetical protein
MVILTKIPPDIAWTHINPLKTKRKLFYLKAQFVPRSKHFFSWLEKPTSLCYIGQKLLFVLG